MKKLNNEALNVTSDQLSKDASLKNYMKSPEGAKTDINIVDKNKQNNSASATNSSPTTTTLEEDSINTQPQYKRISKWVDSNGKASQPFIIDEVQYELIRAYGPDNKKCGAVMNTETGEIFSVEDFDRNVAIPARDSGETPIPSIDPPFHKMKENIDKTNNNQAIDYLNVDDLNGSKHFFVNKNTGEVIAKFPNTRDMIKSGIKLSEDEDYMDAKALRRHRLRKMLDSNDEPIEEDVNLGKLQQDVKRLSKLIKDKFVIALDKINTPIEQSQFLVAMANEIGVPFTKLASIISSFKDISKDQQNDSSMTTDTSTTTSAEISETKIMTKNELLESIKPVSKKIKIKDIKNGRL